jgi:hypothetical protein
MGNAREVFGLGLAQTGHTGPFAHHSGLFADWFGYSKESGKLLTRVGFLGMPPT